jgi:hypothetical protein
MIFWSLLYCLSIINNIKLSIVNKIKITNNCSGYDERPINETVIDMRIIRQYHEKLELLNLLNSSKISQAEKLQLIYKSPFLEDLNPYKIKSSNLTKWLDF